MFTETAVQKNVMCMMNQEMPMDMCMWMSMVCCASMYQSLPGTSVIQSFANADAEL